MSVIRPPERCIRQVGTEKSRQSAPLSRQRLWFSKEHIKRPQCASQCFSDGVGVRLLLLVLFLNSSIFFSHHFLSMNRFNSCLSSDSLSHLSSDVADTLYSLSSFEYAVTWAPCQIKLHVAIPFCQGDNVEVVCSFNRKVPTSSDHLLTLEESIKKQMASSLMGFEYNITSWSTFQI